MPVRNRKPEQRIQFGFKMFRGLDGLPVRTPAVLERSLERHGNKMKQNNKRKSSLRQRRRTVPAILAAAAVTAAVVLSVAFRPSERTKAGEVPALKGVEELLSKEASGTSYRTYLENHESTPYAGAVIELNAAVLAASDGDVSIQNGVVTTDGSAADAVYTGESGTAVWKFEAPESGLYQLQVEYCPAEGSGNDVERNLYLDGKLPYDEAEFLTFTRLWEDEGEIGRDRHGNDIRPKQVERAEWRTVWIQDAAGHYGEPLVFYLEQGTHTLAFEGVREPMYLKKLIFKKSEDLKSYQEIKEEYETAGYRPADAAAVKLQAERTLQKSDYTLYPASDRSSAITEPQDVANVRLNCISGGKYKLPGQWITWEIDIPEDGLYELGLRYKQDLLTGLYSSRKLLIDGKVPFEEAGQIAFPYSSNWEVTALGDGTEAFAFWLTKGRHELTLEVTLGNLAPVITRVSDSLTALNQIYRSILMITGPEPDPYRDYSFERQIPQILESMGEQAEILESISERMEEMIGGKGEQMVILDKISFQLRRMSEDPEKIAAAFSSYKDNIAALATWVLTVSEQPLTLDYWFIAPAGSELPRAEAGFFKSLSFELKSLIMSFFIDYNSLGLTEDAQEGDSGKEIEVWLTSGRDQVSILREMINDSFTPETGIRVTLKLVDASALLPSVLAGAGPDVSLGNAIGDPIQYAIRNALYELNSFPEFDRVRDRFHPSAMISYEFLDRCYALPETQSFPMMFYRKDILDELGLEVPQTWEEFYAIIPELQKNNMEIGFPSGLPGMQIFLYQMGGSLYNEDFSRSTLDADLTVDAFSQLCELFTTYKFPRDFDFPNRFRTGQMPIGIQDYTTYNNLTAFAPEIKGLWEFAPIPGFREEDGTINRAEPCTGTCAVLLKDSKDPQSAWEFLEWWTRAQSQSRFAREMESVLGKAAKYATANMEAMASMPWTKTEYDRLLVQMGELTGTPEVPGGYYLTRSVEFAAKTAYTTGDGEILLDYAKEANEEIRRKREEFGLEQGGYR